MSYFFSDAILTPKLPWTSFWQIHSMISMIVLRKSPKSPKQCLQVLQVLLVPRLQQLWWRRFQETLLLGSTPPCRWCRWMQIHCQWWRTKSWTMSKKNFPGVRKDPVQTRPCQARWTFSAWKQRPPGNSRSVTIVMISNVNFCSALAVELPRFRTRLLLLRLQLHWNK